MEITDESRTRILIRAVPNITYDNIASALIVFVAGHSGLIAPTLAEICPDGEALSPLLTWIYLLTAIGIALTSNRFVNFTAAHVRRASRLMQASAPDHATKSLLVQLWLAATEFAILTLRPPPHRGSSWVVVSDPAALHRSSGRAQ